MKKIDRTGERFGQWTVLGPAARAYQTMWACKCQCGTKRDVSSANLTAGNSTSCGCVRAANSAFAIRNRNYKGSRNPKARKSAARNGGVWVPSHSKEYKRAAGIFHSAKRRGIPIEFTSSAELAGYVATIMPDKCPVFGEEFTSRGVGLNSWSPSIDKIDPKLGYIRGNIQVISMYANRMKQDASPEQLRMFAEWVLRSNR
jgi:hypothetical protein